MSTDLKLMAAQAALTKLVNKSFFDICTIDKIVEMLGVKPEREAYSILSALHCVDYNQMPPALFQELPNLIARIVQSPTFEASRINIVGSGTELRIVRGVA